MQSNMKKGVVFNIQRFTVHDGPGIRTEIFLKGCTLRCKWCSNPESYKLPAQIGVFSSKCIGIDKCGECIKACPYGEEAFISQDGKVVAIDYNKCNSCLKCEKMCPSDALKLWGQEMSVDEVMKVIEQDMEYYRKSGGGVTISGGESLLQWEFTLEILKRCKEKGIHTCVETALNVKSAVVEEVIPYTDLFITDIKSMDSTVHKLYTGVGNECILDNIKRLKEAHKPMVIRLPIIPDVNDSPEHIEEVADFIINELHNRVAQVQFLRFRPLGQEKYQSLGIPYQMEVNTERTEVEENIKELVEQMVKRGISAVAGTTQKIQL